MSRVSTDPLGSTYAVVQIRPLDRLTWLVALCAHATRWHEENRNRTYPDHGSTHV